VSRDTGFPRPVRDLVLARASGNCEAMLSCCAYEGPYEIHHRRPRGMGGSRAWETNSAANALHLCRRCHLYIESNRRTALEYGFLVRQNHDPRAVPVWWRCNVVGGRRVLVKLTDCGSKV
jgi:5-methylcytosine-specific restriction protein A